MRSNKYQYFREGTISVLFGGHSIIHSIYVLKAWKMIYGTYPVFWQIICILIHDIGYFGKDFYSIGSNEGHAELGARLARRLFGEKGFNFVAGHTRSTADKFNIPLSELEPPDDFSWVLVPKWMLYIFNMIEPSIIPSTEWSKLVCQNWLDHGMFNRSSSFDMCKQCFGR